MKTPKSGALVTPETIQPNAIFAFFGHTDQYKALQKSIPDESLRREALWELFRLDIREAARLVHKCIKTRKFDNLKYKWIELDGPPRSGFPKSFTTIAKQIERRRPAITSPSSKVFPYGFAAICLIASDILTMNDTVASESASDLRRLCNLADGEVISNKQNKMFGQLSRELKRLADATSPNWAVTLEDRKAVIRTDSDRYFESIGEVNRISSLIDGRYFVFRRAFKPNPNGHNYLVEYLRIYQIHGGPIFQWNSLIGIDEVETVITGVLALPKNGISLIGYDDKPLPRMWYSSVNLHQMLELSRLPNADDRFATGILCSNMPDEGEPIPAARGIVLMRDQGQFKFEHSTSYFLSELEIQPFLPSTALNFINKNIL